MKYAFDSLMKPLALLALLSTLLCLSGCDDSRPTTAPLTGNVTYNGKSLSIGQIVFVPPAGRSAFGEIKDSEIVNVTTFKRGDGVIPGQAKVSIKCITNMNSIKGPHDPMIPEKFFTPESSGLTFEVKSDSPNEYVVDLKD